MFAAPREPLLESGPELAPVSRLARRQASVARAIATELTGEVAAQMAGREPALAAAISMISIRFGGDA
jgi:hypothetical protein